MFGIIVSVPQKYEHYAIKTLTKLRKKWKVDCPIEIWEIGKEVSDNARETFTKLGNVSFKNIEDFTDDPKHWKGYQAKAFAAQHNTFDEFLLFDADVSFFQNPLIVLDNPGYKATGTFLFRDLAQWQFHNLSDHPKDKWESLDYYNGRKAFLRNFLPEGSPYFPKEWACFYEDKIPTDPVPEAYMEAGVIYMDRTRHADSLEWNYKLNEDHKVTYEFMWGDKDTWWLGCCKCGKPHAINDSFPISPHRYLQKFLPQLLHFYKGKPFFGQK